MRTLFAAIDTLLLAGGVAAQKTVSFPTDDGAKDGGVMREIVRFLTAK